MFSNCLQHNFTFNPLWSRLTVWCMTNVGSNWIIWYKCLPVSKDFEADVVRYDVIKWKYYPRYWPFVWGIHQSSVNFPHNGQWRGDLTFTLICALNKRLSKQSLGWWFETQSRPLWSHCNGCGLIYDAMITVHGIAWSHRTSSLTERMLTETCGDMWRHMASALWTVPHVLYMWHEFYGQRTIMHNSTIMCIHFRQWN